MISWLKMMLKYLFVSLDDVCKTEFLSEFHFIIINCIDLKYQRAP